MGVRLLKRALPSLLACGLLLMGASLGGAQEPAQVVVREVDTTKFPTVRISAQVTGQKPSLASFALRENGKIVQDVDVVPIAETTTKVGVVLAVDTSGSMASNDAMNQAKAAAKQFVAQREGSQEIAIVAFGGTEARVVIQFTADAALLNGAIDGLQPAGETPLWDGVVKALALYDERKDLQPNVVVLSDGADTVSIATQETARASALSRNATIFAVGLQGGDFEEGPIRSVAEATNGQYRATADPTALRGLYAQVQSALQNQYEISYTSTASGGITIDVTVGGSRATVAANAGAISRGVNAKPEFVEPSGGLPGFLDGSGGKLLISLVVLAALGVLALAVARLASRERSALDTALQPYEEGTVIPGFAGEQEGEGAGSLTETAFVKRAVAATAKIAAERGLLVRLERALEQADLPLRAPEALFFYLAAAVLVGVLFTALSGSLFVGLFLMVLIGAIPVVALRVMASLRRRKFTGQLPDTLQLLSGSLRAGYSVMQGVEAVAQEVEDPMGRELRRVQAEARLGRSLDEALQDSAERMESDDFGWAVMAIRIQREVGGNLAELLSTVADTMMARERLRREVRALTAEGRISAILLGIMPVALGVIIYGLNPDYMKPLFEQRGGQIMLVGSGLLAGFGFWWMKKTIEIEV